MAGLGWQELAIVAVIIMIIFGAGKLPEVLKSLGQGVKEFKQEAIAPVGVTEPATASTTGTIHAEANGVVAAAEQRRDEAGATVRTDTTRAEAAARDVI